MLLLLWLWLSLSLSLLLLYIVCNMKYRPPNLFEAVESPVCVFNALCFKVFPSFPLKLEAVYKKEGILANMVDPVALWRKLDGNCVF